MDIRQIKSHLASLSKIDHELNSINERLNEAFTENKEAHLPKDIDPKIKQILDKAFW